MADKNNPLNRQEAIKKLLSEMLISDQKTLIETLSKKFGIKTSQSALSRDFRNLGVIKKEINNEIYYTLPNFNLTEELIRLAVIEIKYNEIMIVIKTHPGLASFVGDYIDQKANQDILGCLAGENVVFIACHSIKNIQETYDVICRKLHSKKKYNHSL